MIAVKYVAKGLSLQTHKHVNWLTSPSFISGVSKDGLEKLWLDGKTLKI